MTFNSISFLIFFPVVTLVYFWLPHRIRRIWLLAASYYFYMCWNVRYAVLMALSTLITYAGGLLIGRSQAIEDETRRRRRKRLWLALCMVSNLGILFVFKYFYFALGFLNTLLSPFSIEIVQPGFTLLLPVGISFYTLQALGYAMDVYNGAIQPEKNVGRYALFVSFFPQLVAGPIERSKNLLSQMYERHFFNYDRVKSGLLLMLWGYFQKLVIADRVAVFVTSAYSGYANQSGLVLVIATLLFAVQIYCDFAGYTYIAIGAAQVMGFRLRDNFRQPYFAASMQAYWSRWHISLSTWLGDYIFTPLVWSRWTSRLPIIGKRIHKPPKYASLMVTFLISGLWHGANWTFVIWGGLHGVFQVMGGVLAKPRAKLYKKLKVDKTTLSFRFGQILTTFLLVCFSYIFFRANSVAAAFAIIARIPFTLRPWVLFDGTLYTLGLNQTEFTLTLFFIGVLTVGDLLQTKYKVRETLAKQNLVFRWTFYLFAILTIVVFGVYGPQYNATPFIYFQF
jgi:D-alanyl-lipoteichoic acid acyltransferase DltB (MBOAT superfamily)